MSRINQGLDTVVVDPAALLVTLGGAVAAVDGNAQVAHTLIIIGSAAETFIDLEGDNEMVTV